MVKRLALLFIELIVAVLLLACAGLFWASHYVDTDEFRTLFTETLSNAVGRQVTLVGDININLWPDVLLEVHEVSLSEDPDFGDTPCAYFDTVHINIEVLPLIQREIDIETIFVDGLEVAFLLNTEGKSNWGSLLENVGGGNGGTLPSQLADWHFSLSNIEVVNTSVRFRDDVVEREYELHGISMRTGEIVAGTPVPVTLSSAFSWADQGIKSDLALTGQVDMGGADSGLHVDDATITATVYGDFLPEGVAPGELVSRVDMDWEHRSVSLHDLHIQFLGLRAEGNIGTGDLSKDIHANGHVTVRPFSPADVIRQYAPNLPIQDVDGLKSSAFASFFHVDGNGIRFTDLVATLDDITARGNLGITGYTKPVMDFELRGNTIDLDRYLPLFRTGTPFIWDDFNLPLFSAFKGKGSVRADGFKILDTLLSDIRLKVSGDKTIVIDAGAIKKGQASLGGRVEFGIGSTGSDETPTLTINAKVDAESQRDGFAFMQGDTLSVGGAGTIKLEARVSEMTCLPQSRSMGIVDNLTADVVLTLGEGTTRFVGKSGDPKMLAYTKGDVNVHFKPGKGEDGYWNTVVTGSAQARGGGDVETFVLTTKGPLSLAYDEMHVKSTGMAINGHVSLSMLPKEARRVTVAAKVAYDSKLHAVEISDGFVQALEMSLNGQASVTGLDKDVKATGHLYLKKADPKRIIYILTGNSIRTEDGEALKTASVDTRFKIDENGFTLHEFRGNLDGMTVFGHIVGTGLKYPMLAFSLSGGALDIDRYLPPATKLTLEEKRSGKIVKVPPVRLPLEFLRALKLNGKVVLKELKLAKIRSQGVSGDIRANNGSIHVSNVTGKTYTGDLTADWEGEVLKEYLTTHLNLHVEDAEAGPLTKDLGKRDYVRGLTDVDIDLASRGATDDDILLNLHGKTWVRMTNGSFKFSGYQKADMPVSVNRSARENEKAAQRAKSRTVFQKAMGYFTVKDGVFTVDKLRVEAPPVLQSYGSGSFSLPDNSINLAIQNDFVVVPSVTIELTGKLTDPQVSIPTGRIVNDTVFNILSIPEKSFNFLLDLFR